MLGQEDNNSDRGASTRRTFLRSVSWTDRSPTKPLPKPQTNNSKARSCLPPLLPLSITRPPVQEWPRPGSDDLGIWPNPQTPRGGSFEALDKSNSEQFQFKKDKLAFFDKECSRIADHIYLGSDYVAQNREVLRQNGITHVLNCVGFVCPEYFKSDLVYKTLWLQDSPSEDITSILYDVFDYFEDVRELGGKVFVHCCQGVSRSSSLVIAYLMWRKGQSFEDAFQYVKAARGVTNPNMGFACQLLQCQKRVHAVPASPNSVLRMYRMAPHSSYDPLHLVPKMLSQPGAHALDSRGAFVVHVPPAIFVWIGKNCNSVMSHHAKVAANQVIRYERAQGPIVSIKEGEESSEFWDALASGRILADACEKGEAKRGEPPSRNDATATCGRIGERRVSDYDLDFELFHKALAGGVVPPFSVSHAEAETCLPARENGWGRFRQKFANGIMREFLTSSNLNPDSVPSTSGSEMNVDPDRRLEQPVSSVEESGEPVSLPSPSAYPCGPPDSFDCRRSSSLKRIVDAGKEEELSIPRNDTFLPLPSPCGSPDSFSCFPRSSPNFSYKSPTLSPSASDYSSSSFTFSPSSSNWSDLSYWSSRQPSPSGLEATDPIYIKNAVLAEDFTLPSSENPPSPNNVFSTNHSLRTDSCLPYRGTCPSIAERRGSNPPPRMLLPSVDEPSQVCNKLIRSCSFSLPDLDDDIMEDIRSELFEHEDDRQEQILDAEVNSADNGSDVENVKRKDHGESYVSFASNTAPLLYQWPNMNKVEMHSFHSLDSGSMYVLLAPDLNLDSNNSGVVYVWLGQEIPCGEGQNESMSISSTSKDSPLYWEAMVRNFLNQIDFHANAPVEIVREGEEPEEFLNHLSSFSFEKVGSCLN